ncbi:MAG TPA: hypothetical protein VKU41_00330 [Polyangiaceae bacterium]|nr:hypothetical protein [Polyangiaceae bacterium]
MTKTLVASAVGLAWMALVPACGGSTSSNSNDAGMSNVKIPEAGANPLMSPALSTCNNCSNGQVCCYNAIAMSGMCQDPAATCSTGSKLSCSKASDCSGSSVCCVSSGGGMGGFNSSCVASSADCMPPADAGGGGFFNFTTQLCDSTHPCPMGDNCTMIMGGQLCFNPAMRFGGGGMMMMDGGDMTMSDAGSGTGSADAGSATD